MLFPDATPKAPLLGLRLRYLGSPFNRWPQDQLGSLHSILHLVGLGIDVFEEVLVDDADSLVEMNQRFELGGKSAQHRVVTLSHSLDYTPN